MNENLLPNEQKLWNRQVEARLRDQNFMKLSPNEVELLLNTIRAERETNVQLVAKWSEIAERLNNAVGPEYWGIRLVDAVEQELSKLREIIKTYEQEKINV